MRRWAAPAFAFAFGLALAGVVNATDLEQDLVDIWTGPEIATARATAEAIAQAIIDYVGSVAISDAQVNGANEADELVLAGDVDGVANANDLDEAAVEAELEAVLDLSELQGAVAASQYTNLIGGDGIVHTPTGTLATQSTETGFVEDIGASTLACGAGTEGQMAVNNLEVLQYCDGSASPTQRWAALGTSAGASRTGDSATAFFTTGLLEKTIGGTGQNTFPTFEVVDVDVTCAVSASYCTIWSVTPASASKGVHLIARIIIDTDSTTVAPQFRVRSADTGYTGICTWVLYDKASGTTTAPAYVNTAIGTAPADTAQLEWGVTTPSVVEVDCGLLADASPGAIVVEWRLETGTTPTQTVLAGSYLVMSN